MKKNKQGEWIAVTPLDLIGWTITVKGMIQEEGLININAPSFIVHAVSANGKTERIVFANIQAIPLPVLEQFKKGG